MCDTADYRIEQGMDAFDAHLRGECDLGEHCQFCDEELEMDN